MKRTLGCVIFISAFLFGCGNNGKEKSDIKKEDLKEVSLNSVKYANELIISFPQSLKLLGNNLLLFFGNGGDVIKFYDKGDLSFKGVWGKLGNGPGEFISPQYCGQLSNGVETKFYMYDFNLRTLREYVVEEENRMKLISAKQMKEKEVYVTNLHILNEHYFLGSIVFGKDEPIVLLDENLNIVSNFGRMKECPEKGVGSQSYVGKFASNGNLFVYAMNDFGYLACYEEQEGNIKQKWTYYMEKPLFDEYGSLDKNKLLDGFWDVAIRDDKVYAIYNGKSAAERKNIGGNRFPTLILVFDIHTGSLCEKYRTDRDICRFAIGADGTIYGVGVNPEVEVVKYKL